MQATAPSLYTRTQLCGEYIDANQWNVSCVSFFKGLCGLVMCNDSIHIELYRIASKYRIELPRLIRSK